MSMQSYIHNEQARGTVELNLPDLRKKPLEEPTLK